VPRDMRERAGAVQSPSYLDLGASVAHLLNPTTNCPRSAPYVEYNSRLSAAFVVRDRLQAGR
jgi:hypothetical protein